MNTINETKKNPMIIPITCPFFLFYKMNYNEPVLLTAAVLANFRVCPTNIIKFHLRFRHPRTADDSSTKLPAGHKIVVVDFAFFNIF